MTAMRQEPANESNVTDMALWLQSTIHKVDLMDAALHDMRAELARRLYGEYLKQDPSFTAQVEKGQEMILSEDNGDRVPGDRFLEWANEKLRT